jgi:hypothetical protein
MPIEIPDQLKNAYFRFIKIAMHDVNARKRPIESGWQIENNYQYNDNEILDWINENYNYGVVCGYGNLAVIDADHEEIEFIVENRLPRTFTVKTGSGGKHYYYIIPDLEKKIVLQRPYIENDKWMIRHCGEIQWKGSQVVGPGSIHPNNNRYAILRDDPIATITNQHIQEILGDYIKKDEPRREYSGENNHEHIDISKIIDLNNFRQKGGEFVGKNPVHGSSTGGNFSININKGIFHCFRCGTGGGPIALIAMLNGLINCQDVRPGCITTEIYKQVVKIAREKYGIIIED